MEEVKKAPPKLYMHCCRVFNSMRAEAVPIQLDTPGGETRHAFIYQGHTTKMFRMLNMPAPYYTSVLTMLQQMGCIRQLSRGGGSAESRWELIDDPSEEAFNEVRVQTKTGKSRLSVVEQEHENLKDRVEQIERRLADTGS